MAERNEIVRFCHGLGMSQDDILACLAHCGYIISARHLRRILRQAGLYRRKNYSDLEDIVLFITLVFN
jgi:hypothetical protein